MNLFPKRQRKAKPDNAEAVMVGFFSKPRSRRTKLIEAGLLITVLIFTAALLSVRYYKIVKKNDQKPTGLQWQDVSKKALNLTYLQKYNEAEQTLINYIDISNKTDKQNIYEAFMQLGSIYINAHRLEDATKAFTKAEAANGKPNISTTLAKGNVAEKAGDKKSAVLNYRQAVELMQHSDGKDFFPGDLEYYQGKVQVLEDKQ